MTGVSIAQSGASTKPAQQSQPTGHEGHNHGAQHAEPTQLDHIEVGQKRSDPNGGIDGNLSRSVLLFKDTMVSTGEILDTESAELEFEFKNTGNETLEIRLVKPSCGCTIPEMEKKNYEPGESGTLKVTFDPTGKKGSISRNITIYTNSETKPVHTVFVQSYVKPVVLTRPRILAFDMTRKGQSRTQDIKVYGRFPEFKVTRATVPDSQNFSVDVIEGGEVEIDGDTMWLQTLRVTLLESAKPASHRTEISVRTNEEAKPIFSLSVVGRVIGDLELTPVRMTIGRLEVGDSFEREVTIRSHSGKAFEIKSVNSSNVVLDADYSAEPVDPELRNEWLIKVNGTVIHPAQRFNAQLNVVTDMVDEELMTVQMYGQLQPKSTP